MALNYHLVKRKVGAGPEKGTEKYFAQVRMDGRIDVDKICQDISESSSATEGDVLSVLNSMQYCLLTYLEEGHIVQMGDLGNFRLTAGSDGALTEKEFKMSMMRTPKVVFTPGKMLRRLLPDVQFQRIDPNVEWQDAPECNEQHIE